MAGGVLPRAHASIVDSVVGEDPALREPDLNTNNGWSVCLIFPLMEHIVFINKIMVSNQTGYLLEKRTLSLSSKSVSNTNILERWSRRKPVRTSNSNTCRNAKEPQEFFPDIFLT